MRLTIYYSFSLRYGVILPKKQTFSIDRNAVPIDMCLILNIDGLRSPYRECRTGLGYFSTLPAFNDYRIYNR